MPGHAAPDFVVATGIFWCEHFDVGVSGPRGEAWYLFAIRRISMRLVLLPSLAIVICSCSGQLADLLNSDAGDSALAGTSHASVTDTGSRVVDTATAPDVDAVADSPALVNHCTGGTFGALISYATANAPQSIAAVDRAGHGRPDIAVGVNDPTVGTVWASEWFANSGDGTFVQALFAGAADIAVSNLVTGDFNGDGLPDLAFDNNNQGIAVYMNNGDGTFAPEATYAVTPSTAYNYGLVAADFDGDGLTDLATMVEDSLGNANLLVVLLSAGGGAFKAPVTYALTINPGALAVGDFNGDGKPDLAIQYGQIATSMGTWVGQPIGVCFNYGDGTFAAPMTFDAGPYVSAMTVADFNGDGISDIAVINNNYLSSATSASTQGISVLLSCGGAHSFNYPPPAP
jgi:hypothetical protein